MDGLKDLASIAIDENADLRRWNASNLDIIYKLGSIQQEIETIVENNALLMDALGLYSSIYPVFEYLNDFILIALPVFLENCRHGTAP